jgi:hypothetical protein
MESNRTNETRVAVVIPTRGDRPQFLDFAYQQILLQTKQPDIIEIMDYPPKSDDKDITQRYRAGVLQAVAKGADCIIFWEDDDYYQLDYIEYMVKQWELKGKPLIFGIEYTYYYHLRFGLHYKHHPGRASMFCTMVSKDAINQQWPHDNVAFTDLYIWGAWRGVTIKPERTMAIGIKHGIGMSGGKGHILKGMYTPNNTFLKDNCTKKAYDFYQSI